MERIPLPSSSSPFLNLLILEMHTLFPKELTENIEKCLTMSEKIRKKILDLSLLISQKDICVYSVIHLSSNDDKSTNRQTDIDENLTSSAEVIKIMIIVFIDKF